MRKVLKWFAGSAIALIASAAAWLAVSPPDLLRIGDAYAAKIVCSNVFLAGRAAADVLSDDVQAPGHPLLRFISISVDDARKSVTARIFGFAAPGHAIYREGLGCTTVVDGDFSAFPGNRQLRRRAGPGDETRPWPEGDGMVTEPALQAVAENDSLTGPGMRGLVVIRNGRIVAERYGEGFNRNSPLLGWSMTKTVTAALIGLRIRDGKMALDRTELMPQWRSDPRSRIALSDLMGMQSGLEFNEDYGSVTDVTRMLFLEGDMAGFAADKPLVAEPGARFSYSSGTSTLLSHLWMSTFDSTREALVFPRVTLFRPLGMNSAVIEPDAHGTFVGSSYMYATARDWARFALFLLRGGRWGDQQILPEGYVDFMRTPTSASKGVYGAGQVWTEGPGNKAIKLPDDAYWMQGHDGQTVMIVPSLDLAVVRLGLTPSSLGYDVRALDAEIIKAIR